MLTTLALLSQTAIGLEECSFNAILGSVPLSDVARLETFPEAARESGHIEVPLFCPSKSIVSDAFGYTALISIEKNIVWIHQYGGYAGVSNWFGPISVISSVAEQCIKQPKYACPEAMIVAE